MLACRSRQLRLSRSQAAFEDMQGYRAFADAPQQEEMSRQRWVPAVTADALARSRAQREARLGHPADIRNSLFRSRHADPARWSPLSHGRRSSESRRSAAYGLTRALHRELAPEDWARRFQEEDIARRMDQLEELEAIEEASTARRVQGRFGLQAPTAQHQPPDAEARQR